MPRIWRGAGANQRVHVRDVVVVLILRLGARLPNSLASIRRAVVDGSLQNLVNDVVREVSGV